MGAARDVGGDRPNRSNWGSMGVWVERSRLGVMMFPPPPGTVMYSSGGGAGEAGQRGPAAAKRPAEPTFGGGTWPRKSSESVSSDNEPGGTFDSNFGI